MKSNQDPPFWKVKTLKEMNQSEWESLCDGCAQCCLLKYEDAKARKLAVVPVACELLDLDTCRCTKYPDRHRLVEDCIELDASNIDSLYWLPETCAYRLIAEGKPLFDWHPLVSGDPDSVKEAGMSIHGSAISERDIHPEDIEVQVIRWLK